MTVIDNLIQQVNEGRRVKMDEEYKERGFNHSRWKQGHDMEVEAIQILRCLGVDKNNYMP